MVLRISSVVTAPVASDGAGIDGDEVGADRGDALDRGAGGGDGDDFRLNVRRLHLRKPPPRTVASAPMDAPHRSFFMTRASTFRSKNIG